MRRKVRKHRVYRKKKTQFYFNNLYIILLLLFISGLFITGISNYFLFNQEKNKATLGFSTDTRFQFITGEIKNNPQTPEQISTLATLLMNLSISQTPTPKPKKEGFPAVAQAQSNEAKDYCLNVPILLYHHIEPLDLASKAGHAQLTVDSNYFDMQMQYLADNKYNSISAEELASALINKRPLPEKSIIITMDDGYEDNYIYAFQILKKYNIAGNFMIPTGLVENNGYMSWPQLKEISDSPNMHVYNHTVTHAYLEGETKEKIQNEILNAHTQLGNNLGKSIKIFTYPYGAFNQQVIDILKENGFIAAFSTISDNIQCNSNILSLHRIHIGNASLSSYGL